MLSDSNYEIEAREINNDNNPDAIPLFLTSGFATYDELELVDDIDTFQIDVEDAVGVVHQAEKISDDIQDLL